ncbi:TetR/AcrR family transcriptional regulator [Gehongia tenuis]|uniref:TetR family transcriptional regulator n=1 Tax=Gehongia tenuis TaxID=2763655 RepID=A0A926D693_9FIRM|nr:TetR/AcrR family transcriptional regulator [Gehongia tenuis]MBC8532207.1 TetR family transcriptional regulator [Gehongia tenuis]
MDGYEEKRRLLFQKALELFEKTGNVTIRQLAQEANMNISAVNYYYRNKENLVKDIQAYIMDSLVSMTAEADKLDVSPREKLEALLKNFMDYLIASPGVARFLYSILGKQDELSVNMLWDAIDGPTPIFCMRMIREETGIENPAILFHRYLAAMCSLIPSAAFGMMGGLLEAQMSDRFKVLFPVGGGGNIHEFVDAYMNSLMVMLLAPQ